MIRIFLKINIFAVEYTSVSSRKYFAKNLEFCEPRNLLFSAALNVTKLQFCGFPDHFNEEGFKLYILKLPVH